MELDSIRKIQTADLTFPLQTSNGINESRIPPGFNGASGMRGGDNVGGGFFNHPKTIEF